MTSPPSPLPGPPYTHSKPHQSNPIEFFKIYSVISMSPVVSGEIKILMPVASDLAFLVSHLK